MSAEQDSAIATSKSPSLKRNEPEIDNLNPWGDDMLGRHDVATRLTNLIASQELPLTISLHGEWGTGKTFMLRRWQKTLENDRYQAIYFNAWEDDFCDEPLLSIVGQLSDHFKTAGLKKLALKVADYAVPLIAESLLGVASATVGLKLNVEHNKNQKQPLLDTYLEQRKTKDQLKVQLSTLSQQVARESKHPLVFIVDELDRCRPTFAIELLERVKHIFDVPNTVFVFGLNRDELCKSIQSVYGEIEAGVYLRRFFDMEFNLPEGKSESFARHMMKTYGVMSFADEKQITEQTRELDILIHNMPILWGNLGLSLRDIDYCVRLVALVTANLQPGQFIYPWILSLLIPLKIKNPVLFHEFIQDKRRGSEVMEYIYENVPARDQYSSSSYVLEQLEAYLYLTDKRFGVTANGGAPALDQLRLLEGGSDLTRPEFLTRSTRTADIETIRNLIRLIEFYERPVLFDPSPVLRTTTIRYVASLINLNQELVRR